MTQTSGNLSSKRMLIQLGCQKRTLSGFLIQLRHFKGSSATAANNFKYPSSALQGVMEKPLSRNGCSSCFRLSLSLPKIPAVIIHKLVYPCRSGISIPTTNSAFLKQGFQLLGRWKNLRLLSDQLLDSLPI